MKILYVAMHGPADNQDEDAISYCLEQQGHEVQRIHQKEARSYFRHKNTLDGKDFLLFHKWEDVDLIAELNIPKFCWYFDLVESEDFTEGAGNGRVEWCTKVEKCCNGMFHTDGDWTAKDTDKRIWLMQGMDERVAGISDEKLEGVRPVIFVGGVRYSHKRVSLIQELKEKLGNQFEVRGEHARTRIHGRELAKLYNSTVVCIGPDNVTNRYWSNRVWNTLGLGGFLIHAYSAGLAETLPNVLPMYESRERLFELIDWFIKCPEEAKRVASWGHEAIMKNHLYRHRVEQLIKHVQERL